MGASFNVLLVAEYINTSDPKKNGSDKTARSASFIAQGEPEPVPKGGQRSAERGSQTTPPKKVSIKSLPSEGIRPQKWIIT